MSLRLCTLLALTAPLLCAQAKDLAVKIDYETIATGADGVTRTTRYTDQLIRHDNDSWQMRVIPRGAHQEADHHKADKGHKHLDMGSAARWVTRTADGQLQVRLVSAHDKVVVDVSKPEYPNIGFDGEWSSASQLMGTEQARKMTPLNQSAPAGSRWLETRHNGLTVRVLWDEQQEFPRKIESAHTSGLYRSTVTVTPQALPTTWPWTQIKGYGRKEYSDFLD